MAPVSGQSAYPRQQQEGVPDPTGWRLWRHRLLFPVLTLAVLIAVVVLGLAFLYAVDPMGDEWVCSQGEAPAGGGCYPRDKPLPAGVHWDPLGNRPMSYNCHKRGWTLIEDDRGAQDCLHDDIPMPAGWHEAS